MSVLANGSTRHLVLFDFDGTISRHDTLFSFLRHTHSAVDCLARCAFVSPILAAHFLGIGSAAMAKASLLSVFYGGWHRQRLDSYGLTFATALCSSQSALHATVVERLARYVDRGDEVCIVSASPSVWVRPFAHFVGAQAICTELEYDHDGRFTGRLAGPNVNGLAKAAAVKARYSLAAFSTVVAFGNSCGDIPMLELAKEAYIVSRNGDCERIFAKSCA